MPDRHKTPVLGWRAPSDLATWLRAEAKRQSITITALITEAVARFREAADKEER